MNERAVRSERGSLPVVMMAILIVGGLITVLVGTIVVGQRQTRFDQGFEQSLSIAEIGLERMVYQVKSRNVTASFSLPETAVAGGRYSGTAVRADRKWTLIATGTVERPCPATASPSTPTPCRSDRTLTLTIRTESVYGVAAYGRTQLDLQGGNSADSYRSGTFTGPGVFAELVSGSNICRGLVAADPFNTADSGSTRMCAPTGKGVVATNGELFLKSGIIDSVDRAEIHYAREFVANPLPGATGYCAGVSATCRSPRLQYLEEPMATEPDPVLPPAGTKLGVFPGVSSGVCPADAPAGTTACMPPGPQIHTNVTLDSKTFIEGTPENPTIIYLTGTLTIPNGAVVNFRQNSLGKWVPKPAPGLLIYSAGIGPALRFGNHASFSGAVYAPRATFAGGAAGNIYGSLVTGSISTQGSWNFHYDEALGAVDVEGRFLVSGWAERRG